MNEMEYNLVKHCDLSDDLRIKIAELKNQHWPYGIESQINWINNNTQANDYHLLGLDNNRVIRAYLTIVNVKISNGEKIEDAVGIGGVCVDKRIEHSGIGKQLVTVANTYIKKKAKMGILLCKDMHIEFYKKCKWIKADYEMAFVDGQHFEEIVMTYPCVLRSKSIVIDRNF